MFPEHGLGTTLPSSLIRLMRTQEESGRNRVRIPVSPFSVHAFPHMPSFLSSGSYQPLSLAFSPAVRRMLTLCSDHTKLLVSHSLTAPGYTSCLCAFKTPSFQAWDALPSSCPLIPEESAQGLPALI